MQAHHFKYNAKDYKQVKCNNAENKLWHIAEFSWRSSRYNWQIQVPIKSVRAAVQTRITSKDIIIIMVSN